MGGRSRVGLIALVAFVGALYVRPLALGETYFLRDAVRFMLGSRAAVHDALRAGHIPEWNDRVGLGQPLAANPVHGVLYPPALVVTALAPPAVASDLLVILHALLGALGAAALARRFGAGVLGQTLAGVAFAGAGYVHTMAVNGIPALTLAWTPWLAVAADRLHAATRPRLALAVAHVALVVGIQLLSGDPAGVVTSVLLAAVVVGARAERVGWGLLRLAGAVTLGLPLAAAGLAPGLLLAADSTRAGGLATADATVWSLHPWRLVELVWPSALGAAARPLENGARLIADAGARGQLDASWSLALHVSAVVLAGAAIAAFAADPDVRARRGRRILLVASLGFVVLALGQYTPIYAAYRAVMPPERLLRYPEKHLAAALVLWAALAGVGLERVFDGRAARGARVLAVAAAALAVLGGGAWLARSAIAGALEARRPARPPPVLVEAVLHGAWHTILIAVAVAAAFAALAFARSRVPRAGWLAAGVLALGLLLAAWPTLPTLPRDVFTTPPPWMAGVVPAPATTMPPERVFRRELVEGIPLLAGPEELATRAHGSLGDRTASLYGLADLPGYDPSLPARHDLLFARGENEGVGRLADLFDVRWLILHDTLVRWRSPGFTLTAHGPNGAGLYENPGRRTRAFVATGHLPVESPEAAIKALFADGLDVDAVRLEGPVVATKPSAPRRACGVTASRPERRVLTCPDGPAGHAVLLDAWSRGWSATVDGAAAPILRADGVVMAVAVPAGAHTVAFAYHTPGLRGGLGVSVASWALLTTFLAWERRRRRA